ncbi:S24 family peptidase [Cerasicoccus arenae]|uniref:Uncharacterized protein n=1 Tax=Cerasicoccus arenae TaxID=424488 RepID=A0A8J3DGF6_9BACT|nr:S24 family peptidase [Cerasicoccus arenae]MBK1858972.1 hypothetical protein [Cerasicoccus arenae]GHC04173.1 hypothetical protein GCM10007047_21070 [Cerasicoccus arenae]
MKALISLILFSTGIFGLVSLEASNVEVSMHTTVPLKQAIQDAMKVADRNANWEVMLGQGKSMSPYFNSGSVLLVDNAPFRKLKQGMMVVFKDAEGDWECHWLVRKEADKWVTQGVNNASVDPDLIGESNYRGVVFGVLNSAGAEPEGLAYAQSLGLESAIGKTR